MDENIEILTSDIDSNEKSIIEADAIINKRAKSKDFSESERLKAVYQICALTTPRFIKGRFKKGISTHEALESLGISQQRFNYWLKKNPELQAIYEESKSGMLEMSRFQARTLVEAGLNGELKLKDSERVNLAMRLLEKTDKEFKDKKEIEVNLNQINFMETTEQLEQKAMLLLSKIKSQENEQGDELRSSTSATSEQTEDGKDS